MDDDRRAAPLHRPATGRGARGPLVPRRGAIALAAGAAAGAALGGLAVPARAQGGSAYPSRPIRVVVPVPAGGALDLVMRPLGQQVLPVLGQPMFLDNKPGASQTLGTQLVAHAPADGYTLLLSNDIPFSLLPALGTATPYDPDRDFVPLSLLSDVSLLLVTGADFPAADVPEFIRYVKAHPGQVNYSTGGVGSPHHVAMERLMAPTGMDMLHVPYQGIPPAFNALLAGQVNAMLVALAIAGEHLKSGRLKALAFTGARRHPLLPQVPTFRESGFPDYVVSAWFGIFAPAGTPPDITQRLSSVLWAAASSKEFNDKVLLPGGFDPTPSVAPGQFPAFIREDRRKWRESVAKIDPRKFAA